MSSFLRLFALVSLYAHLTYAATVYADASELSSKSYDYIVVGGGLAGSTIAGRLAENASAKILVIEAGISNENVVNSIVPFFCILATPRTELTWNYTTTPQTGLKNRVIEYPRGRMLGGSSSVNVMVYTRGSSEEYDRLATATGDSSWSYKKMYPYILKHEKWMPPQDGHDTTGQYDPQYHSTTGKVQVTLPNSPFPGTDERVINALGGEFPFVQDMNSGKPLGFGWMQSMTGGGSRSSSATAYLDDLPNLDILVQTTVTRVIQNGKKNGLPLFNTVEFATSASSSRVKLTAKKEVILSAGAVNTPQLLLLSGIGPKADLDAYGITTIVNSKDVGKKMQDHALAGYQFEVTGNYTIQTIAADIPDLLSTWQSSKKGPLSNTIVNQIGWTRLNSTDSFIQQYGDPSAGPNSPHIEYLFGPGFISFVGQTADPNTNYLSVYTAVASSNSRGSITLQSTNPFDSPLIDPALLSTPLDVHTAVEAARGVLRFMGNAAWDGYVVKPYADLAKYDFTNDADVEDYVRTYTATEWHPSGTAAMSSASSADGVVNNKLCVKGASGLRIVDASVFPAVPGAHPSAFLYAIAEKAADMIKAASC